MIDITGTTIEMTRGDSLSVTIVMKDATGQPAGAQAPVRFIMALMN